jgi:hypothetical protein
MQNTYSLPAFRNREFRYVYADADADADADAVSHSSLHVP